MTDDPAPTPKPAPAPTETFSREYVNELREENKRWRLTASDKETIATTAATAAEKAKAEADALIAEVTTKADQRIITAELRRMADKAGLVDLDALKLFDTSAVKLDANGDVIVPDGFFDTARKAKPWAFQTSTSNPAPAPKPGAGPEKKFADMTPEERKVASRALGIN